PHGVQRGGGPLRGAAAALRGGGPGGARRRPPGAAGRPHVLRRRPGRKRGGGHRVRSRLQGRGNVLRPEDAERRKRVLALTDQVMIEHAYTLDQLGARCDIATTDPDGNRVEVIAPVAP